MFWVWLASPGDLSWSCAVWIEWAGSCVTLACSNEFQCLISIATSHHELLQWLWKWFDTCWVESGYGSSWRIPFSLEGCVVNSGEVWAIWLQIICAIGDPSDGLSISTVFRMAFWTAKQVALEHVCLARRPHKSTRQIGLGDVGESAARKKTRPFKRN